MEKILVIVMLVLLIAPVLIGVRRLRRTLARPAAPKDASEVEPGSKEGDAL